MVVDVCNVEKSEISTAMNGNVRDVMLSEVELYSGNFLLQNDENNDRENIIT